MPALYGWLVKANAAFDSEKVKKCVAYRTKLNRTVWWKLVLTDFFDITNVADGRCGIQTSQIEKTQETTLKR